MCLRMNLNFVIVVCNQCRFSYLIHLIHSAPGWLLLESGLWMITVLIQVKHWWANISRWEVSRWHWNCSSNRCHSTRLHLINERFLLIWLIGVTKGWTWHRWKTISSSYGIFPMVVYRLWRKGWTINKWNRLRKHRNKNCLNTWCGSQKRSTNLHYCLSLRLCSFDDFYR